MLGYEALPEWVVEGREPERGVRDEGGREEYVEGGRGVSAGERLDGALFRQKQQRGMNGGVDGSGVDKSGEGVWGGAKGKEKGKEKSLDDWLAESEGEEEEEDEEDESEESTEDESSGEEESESEEEVEEEDGDEKERLVK